MNSTPTAFDPTQVKKVFTPNYNPAPFLLSHGKGSFLYDTAGKKYLDFSSGISVNNLGHCQPEIVSAISKQAKKLIHCSAMFWNQPAVELAKQLTSLSFADEVFLCNSGTETNEAALKLAKKYFYDQGKSRPKILAFEGGFHGRSMGSLSATYKEKYRTPFQPLLPGFEFAKFNQLSSIEKISEETAAVIIEPVQGEAGVRPATTEFLKALRKRCTETKSLLIFDCIQTGMYRIGSLFGYENSGVIPDVLSLAKALGGGLPIGAMLTKKDFGMAFTPGAHGTTFGGNPVAAAASLAVLGILTNESFQSQLQKAQRLFAEAAQ